jgi:hypothetical protein
MALVLLRNKKSLVDTGPSPAHTGTESSHRRRHDLLLLAVGLAALSLNLKILPSIPRLVQNDVL